MLDLSPAERAPVLAAAKAQLTALQAARLTAQDAPEEDPGKKWIEARQRAFDELDEAMIKALPPGRQQAARDLDDRLEIIGTGFFDAKEVEAPK
jgi:hypothetical protein